MYQSHKKRFKGTIILINDISGLAEPVIPHNSSFKGMKDFANSEISFTKIISPKTPHK